MKETQFRILYRQFLFRMVDLELLSADARGDMGKLFGQFAALLIFISVVLCLGAGLAAGELVLEWSGVNFMIATTMLVVGLFAILSWDSTFPDRRDVMVLVPLPIRSRTIFFAKIAAVGTALSITVAALHFPSGFVWPLTLNHRHEAVIAPSIAYEAAMQPLNVGRLETVLRQDLDPALKNGVLSPGTGGGAAVGVWKSGEQRIFAYGNAKPDSLFEIGSITKTFTALALAQFVVRGTARLDEPLRQLLPPDTVRRPVGAEITLLDLATHRSGLPGLPNNLHPQNPRNPLFFPEYDAEEICTFLRNRGVAKPGRVNFSYSNLGFAVLGQALANRMGVSYANLLRGITGPLGMTNTVVDLSPDQRKRMVQGYDGSNTPMDAAELGALAPAGAIRSNAVDMLQYLVANLHPERLAGLDELRKSIEEQHKLRAQITPGASIALSWLYGNGTYWHNGATAGFTSYAFFNPAQDYAVVVLTNRGHDLFGFAGVLGEHIRQRLTGRPAISFHSVVVPASDAGVLDLARLLMAWWVTMLMAGAFIYCSVLGIQGLAAQLLPRRYFLRVSSLMQLAAFGILVVGYFLEPKLVAPSDLIEAQSSTYLEWSPSYWFLGIFQQLKGSPALPELARRGWIGVGIALASTAIAYTLAYFRTLRRIVEEPDIAPAQGGRNLLPKLGNGFATAIGQFSIRTVLRSRQHRLLLAFYLAVGFSTTILFPKWPVMRDLSERNAGEWGDAGTLALIGSTILIAALFVAGTRITFSLPMDLRANWIFRITPVPAGSGCLVARRRALYVISVVPICLGTATLLFSIWPWQMAMKHLIVIVLIGSATAELCLGGTQKLPFTCSYLPGKLQFNMTFLLFILLVFSAVAKAAQLECASFNDAATYAAIVGGLMAVIVWARRRCATVAKSEEGELRFEETADPALFVLDLHRDGVTPIAYINPAD